VIWKKIEEWGRDSGNLSDNQQSIAWNLSLKVRSGSNILPNEISNGISIIEKVIGNAPELISENNNPEQTTLGNKSEAIEITIDLIKKMVSWDRTNKRLKPHHFAMMFDIVNGKTPLTEQNKKYCLNNLNVITKYGFKT
jgi:hypothetical protein